MVVDSPIGNPFELLFERPKLMVSCFFIKTNLICLYCVFFTQTTRDDGIKTTGFIDWPLI